MSELVLKSEVLDKIKNDPILFGKVAGSVGKSLSYTLRLLTINDDRLTKASVLKILREHLNVNTDAELLTETEAAA